MPLALLRYTDESLEYRRNCCRGSSHPEMTRQPTMRTKPQAKGEGTDKDRVEAGHGGTHL